jgi:hypothetical protein
VNDRTNPGAKSTYARWPFPETCLGGLWLTLGLRSVAALSVPAWCRLTPITTTGLRFSVRLDPERGVKMRITG